MWLGTIIGINISINNIIMVISLTRISVELSHSLLEFYVKRIFTNIGLVR